MAFLHVLLSWATMPVHPFVEIHPTISCGEQTACTDRGRQFFPETLSQTYIWSTRNASKVRIFFGGRRRHTKGLQCPIPMVLPNRGWQAVVAPRLSSFWRLLEVGSSSERRGVSLASPAFTSGGGGGGGGGVRAHESGSFRKKDTRPGIDHQGFAMALLTNGL